MSKRRRKGAARAAPTTPNDDAAVIRHEEEAQVEKRWEPVGYGRIGRKVEVNTLRADIPRVRQELAHERVPVDDADSGEVETLPDGSISIPLFEEEIVVTKQTVLRERVIIRKELTTEWETVEAELRREHVTFENLDEPRP